MTGSSALRHWALGDIGWPSWMGLRRKQRPAAFCFPNIFFSRPFAWHFSHSSPPEVWSQTHMGLDLVFLSSIPKEWCQHVPQAPLRGNAVTASYLVLKAVSSWCPLFPVPRVVTHSSRAYADFTGLHTTLWNWLPGNPVSPKLKTSLCGRGDVCFNIEWPKSQRSQGPVSSWNLRGESKEQKAFSLDTGTTERFIQDILNDQGFRFVSHPRQNIVLKRARRSQGK